MLVHMADSATRTVIHIKQRVVAPADHPITNRQLPAPVGELFAELTLVPAQRACRLVERPAGVVVAGDHHRLLNTNLANGACPLDDRGITRAGSVFERVDPSGLCWRVDGRGWGQGPRRPV